MENPSPIRNQGTDKLAALRDYFASGWLFFLPYLAVYLVFWFFSGPVPLALSIFWTLHAIHLACLIAVAVRFKSIFRDPRLWFFAGVGAIFCLQGAYMEFPGDNWSHAQRIFVWNDTDNFSEHVFYDKKKSGFFFLASLIGWIPLSLRYAALTACAALMAVLLAYQIWRFLRTCGLGEAAAFLGVIASILFMGTPIQFYGYYGLSSTSLSMVGVFTALAALLGSGRSRYVLWFLALVFSAFNHLQGAPLILLGTLAILCWHAQNRFGTAKFVAVLGSVAIAAFGLGLLFVTQIGFGQKIWASTENLRADGWMSSFGSIRIWDFSTLGGEGAATRFLEIVTWLGLLNFAAAVYLIAKKRVLGWITLTPLLAVVYPVTAAMVAYAHNLGDDIITYHRYLLLVLPLAALIELAASCLTGTSRFRNLSPAGKAIGASVGAMVVFLVGLPDGRHWLGKLRMLGKPAAEVGRLAFLDPVADQLETDPRFEKRQIATIADPATATYLATHLGHYTPQFRLAVNDASNPVFGNIANLEARISEFPAPVWTLCVIIPKQDPNIPLHFSPNGSISRHWRTFAINAAYQFDPATLDWCKSNLTGNGWEAFDLGPSHRCFVRFGAEIPK